jgi:hypothetical protein
LAAVAVALIAACLGAQAHAGESVDLSTSITSVSSPGNIYGPWVTTDASVRLLPGAETGFEFTNRRASNLINPSTAWVLEVNNYHKFSRRLSTFAAVDAGSAAPYPRSRFAAEVDVSLTKHIGAALGGSTANDYVVGGLQQAHLGLDYFFGDNYASVRYIPTWSPRLGSSHAYSFAIRGGVPGKTTETLRLGAGGENDTSLINAVNPTLIGEYELGAGVSIKHWTGADRGYHVDLGYGQLNHAHGATIYSAVSVGGGLFFRLP